MCRITAVGSMVLLVLLAWTGGCSDSPIAPRQTPALGLIVSAPVARLGGSATGVRALASGSPASASAVYVSLPPGAVPTGLLATVRNQATGQSVTTAVVDGGFDPVAILANVGDTLAVDITRTGSAALIHGWELVRAHRPPVVVRTDPPVHKMDVPLNSIVVVVFSEPIDSATLNTRSVQLWRGPTPVAGTVRFSEAAGIRAEFHPDSLLAGQTEYRLLVTQAIRSVNGGALASPVAVQFTTGTTGPAAGLVFASVSAGGAHTCGVTTAGAAYCWGINNSGQLGSGTKASSSTPVAVAGGLTFAAVSAGGGHTCGVTTGGEAFCWGLNNTFQLGSGWTPCGGEVYCLAPVAVAGRLTFAAVSAGGWHTCGVTTSGAAYCWGEGIDGELGNGPPGVYSPTPVAVLGGLTFATVSAGRRVTCGATTAAAAYCWGFGPIGTDTTTWAGNCTGDGFPNEPCSLSPVAVAGGLSFQTVSAGYYHACGVAPTGAAYCWGCGAYCSWAYTVPSPSPYSATPVAVAGGLSFTAVSAGQEHDCGVTRVGPAYCWGRGDFGNLGNGTTTSSATPVAVVGGLSFATVSAGAGHTCGVTTGGEAYCWGDNNYGQLGNGTATSSTVPVKVAGQP